MVLKRLWRHPPMCSLPDFYLGMDLHGKCAESCVDWKGWLKVLEAYTHHRAANQLQKPVLRQIVDRAPFWTRSAQRLARVADISSYMEGHRRHVLRHGAKRDICLWCHLIGACCCLHWSQPSHREAVPDCALTCSWPHMQRVSELRQVEMWINSQPLIYKFIGV